MCVCVIADCAGAVACRLCGVQDVIVMCAIVLTMTTCTLICYDCHDTCGGDDVDGDACTRNDYTCNDAEYV